MFNSHRNRVEDKVRQHKDYIRSCEARIKTLKASMSNAKPWVRQGWNGGYIVEECAKEIAEREAIIAEQRAKLAQALKTPGLRPDKLDTKPLPGKSFSSIDMRDPSTYH